MGRLKIYFLLANVKLPLPIAGDKINELVLMKCLSQFADVYYNDQLVKPDQKNFGLKSLPINSKPKRKYDLYYVRNNKSVFMKLPHPKVWVGSPYDDDCYRVADAIITFTDAWKTKLLDYNTNPKPGLYRGSRIRMPQKVITFHQAVEPQFKPDLAKTKTCQKIRKQFGGDFVIGHFGRVSKSCYPYSLLQVIPELKKRFPKKKIRVIFCGHKAQWHEDINSPHVKIMAPFDRKRMPYALAACDVVLCNYRSPTAHWGGCRRIIESMATGVPIMCGGGHVRKEQLGENYPLFWKYVSNKGRISKEAELQMLEHLSSLIQRPNYGAKIGQKLIERSWFYSISENAKRMQRDIILLQQEYLKTIVSKPLKIPDGPVVPKKKKAVVDVKKKVKKATSTKKGTTVRARTRIRNPKQKPKVIYKRNQRSKSKN